MTVEKKDIDWGSLGFGYMKTDYLSLIHISEPTRRS